MKKLETPKGWRKGQALFNFLWWLKYAKKHSPEFGFEDSRMADPFYISDKDLEKFYKEFLNIFKI